SRPAHPYTQALLAAEPRADPRRRRERMEVHGEPPSPLAPPGGCPFHPRCPVAIARCRVEEPARVRVGEGHEATCHLLEGEVAGEG
ncbi:MAG TPA: oligopeptide/dipeptide ABC transporter ATP-binding protein, partial [Planctomycetota bacterium]|nr:oligopeptide/dipeptide ABC transporter ATP-binding protein [Planctomycetota bacterium]